MLPASVLGSAAAWPALRTVSLFRILYVALCFGGAIWVLRERRFPRGIRVRGLLLFLSFWMVWTLFSLIWADDKVAGIRYAIFLVMMVSLSMGTVLAADNPKRMRIALILLLAVFALSLAVGLLEIGTDFRLPTSGLVGRDLRYQWAATSIFYNQNDFATYIALWLPFLLVTPFLSRSVSALVASILGALVSAICLLYTGSRTNLLALGLAVPSTIAILALRKGSSRWWQWTLGIALILAVSCTVFVGMRGGLLGAPLPAVGVQHWRFDTLGAEIGTGTGSGGTRIMLIEGGLEVARSSRLLGVGPGNAEYHLRQLPGLDSTYNLHNWWLEVLVDGGLLVFLGHLLFYGSLLYGLFLAAIRSGETLMVFAASALFAALMGYIFGSLSPSSAIHFTPMWIHFGLSMAVINLHRRHVSYA
jgi:O-antigen ligase